MDINLKDHKADNFIFFEDVIKFIPRILSLLDRNRYSPTYGCFDRNYWHYKTLTDFPSAIYQYGTLILALLYDNQFTGNIYYKNPDILKYTKAGMLFWSKIQNRDGSFNEWYPNEHSYVASAFTTYAISESFLILKDMCKFSEKERNQITKAIDKSSFWLSKNSDEFASNHIAGAIIALHNAYLIGGNEKFKAAKDFNIAKLLKNQNNEGWFYEYGGADIGYLTVTIDFLAKYYQKTGDVIVKDILTKALDFLVYFFHPGGSLGGEYGSRNTKYFFLHGLKILSSELESASYILDRLSQDLRGNPLLSILYSSDDRYCIFFFLGNLLQASLEQTERKIPIDITLNRFSRIFSESGIATIRNSNYQVICNFKKGGVIKIFSIGKESSLNYSDDGYFGYLNNGSIISTQWLNPDVSVKIKDKTPKDIVIEIKQQFSYVNFRLPLVNFLVPFRIFNYTLGHLNIFANYFSRILKRYLIIKNRKAPVFLNRKIEISEYAVIVCDEVIKKGRFLFKNLNIQKNVTTMHVPSSRYFLESDLNYKTLDADFSNVINKDDSFKLSIMLKFDGAYPSISAELNDKNINSIINL